MILGFGLRMMSAGLAIGRRSARFERLLFALQFHVSAVNPLIFSLATAVLVGMAILASFLPARRATRIDPMQALRNE